ncbi:Maf family nucleotide pyrophosphatase [Alphaproteobacteria bacterium]|nr:Maf family nucleotide pyrophosphatase [Alphaproteobacteria bacterium]
MTSLILASGSSARASLLRGAAVPFDVEVSGVDEAAIKDKHDGSPEDLCLALAAAKAAKIATDKFVIGADQILICDGKIYDKPADLNVARSNLLELKGKDHHLVNGVVIYRNGEIVWQFSNRIRLRMRDFSSDFLDQYIAHQGDTILSSVGSYRLEAMGPHLFDDIEGDYFSILGLPLLPLLDELRKHGLATK